MPDAISNAMAYPAVSPLLRAARVRGPFRNWLVVTVAATVPSTAMPSEPPSCRPTFSSAEAIPDSSAVTPEIAVMLVDTKTPPRPMARTTSGPSTRDA